MEVYLLCSNWMHNGDNAVNEVIGIYDCLPKAQQAAADCANHDMQNHSYQNAWCDTEREFHEYNVFELSNMSYDDPEFDFDIRTLKLWNGNDDDFCEDYQYYYIVKRLIL